MKKEKSHLIRLNDETLCMSIVCLIEYNSIIGK